MDKNEFVMAYCEQVRRPWSLLQIQLNPQETQELAPPGCRACGWKMTYKSGADLPNGTGFLRSDEAAEPA